MTRHTDPLLTDEAVSAATDRIAWAMLVSTGVDSPRAEWADHADEWRQRAEGAWQAALQAATATVQGGHA